MRWLTPASLSLILCVAAAVAQQAEHAAHDALPAGFETQAVLRTTTTADGDPLPLPPAASVEIVSVIGTLEAGGRTALHQHPAPVYVYVLEGELEIQSEGGEPRLYEAGEAFMESVDRWHQAFNKADGQTKILVVFIGEEGKPTTIAAQ